MSRAAGGRWPRAGLGSPDGQTGGLNVRGGGGGGGADVFFLDGAPFFCGFYREAKGKKTRFSVVL